MANGEASRSHARARQLLKERQDILVHPTNALTDDSAEMRRPAPLLPTGEVLVRNEAGQVDAFERAADQFGLPYRRRRGPRPPKLRGKATELPSPLPAAARLSRPQRRTARRYLVPVRRPRSRRVRGHAEPRAVRFGVVGHGPVRRPPLAQRERKNPSRGDGTGVYVAVVDTGLPRGYQRNPVLHGTSRPGRLKRNPGTTTAQRQSLGPAGAWFVYRRHGASGGAERHRDVLPGTRHGWCHRRVVPGVPTVACSGQRGTEWSTCPSAPPPGATKS